MNIINIICHRNPERSFFINGHQFPVCARCTGFYISLILYFTYTFYYFVDYNTSLLTFAFILLIPTAISDLAISGEGYGMYDVTCTLVPDKDYDYLEAQVIFYDSDDAVIEKSPLVWNMNDVQGNQTIKVSGNAYISGDDSPAKAKVLFFDSAVSNEESEAIFTQELNM